MQSAGYMRPIYICEEGGKGNEINLVPWAWREKDQENKDTGIRANG